jgi:uncharacterized membrane protein
MTTMVAFESFAGPPGAAGIALGKDFDNTMESAFEATPPMPTASHTPPLSKARLEALTDGIFAVTMTLLVLDLKFPDAEPDQTAFDAFLTLVDRLDNYVISFVVLGVFWLGHQRLFNRCREVDVGFLVLNLAFLLFTTLVPPLTTLLGDHPRLPRAAVLYGGNLLLILGCELLLWRRVLRELHNESVRDPGATWLVMRRRYALAMGVVVAGIAIALVEIELRENPNAAPYVYLLLIGAGLVRPPTDEGLRA